MSIAPLYRRCQNGAICFTTCPECIDEVRTFGDAVISEQIVGYASTYEAPYFTDAEWKSLSLKAKQQWWRDTDYGRKAPPVPVVEWLATPLGEP